jgi:hypothetical protein
MNYLRTRSGFRLQDGTYCSYLGQNHVLYLIYRFSGKHIRDERPTVLRFKVIGLSKERLVHVESTVKFIVLVPLVLSIVYLVVHRRLGKVKLLGDQ